MDGAEREGRRALNRIRRGVEKGLRDLEALEGALRHAEGEDFPADSYAEVREWFGSVLGFIEEEEGRLEAKILQAGGLEPGRIRRSSSS